MDNVHRAKVRTDARVRSVSRAGKPDFSDRPPRLFMTRAVRRHLLRQGALRLEAARRGNRRRARKRPPLGMATIAFATSLIAVLMSSPEVEAALVLLLDGPGF